MIPFKSSYYQNKIEEFGSKVKTTEDFSVNNCRIYWDFYKEGKHKGYMHVFKGVLRNVPCLYENDIMWMSLNGEEIGGYYEVLKRAKGVVGVVGLGIGYFVEELSSKGKVEKVIVYESNRDIIEIYNKLFDKNEKIEIINCDARDATGGKFDFFFVDIYRYQFNEEIVEDYQLFNKNHDIKEYSFFGMEHFVLSLREEDIEEKILPEYWLAMSKNVGDKFFESRYKDNFIPISYKKVKNLYNKFKSVFM
ncbi:hypothetical protein [uncultured Clostridium sp.]|uniref:hypothetical protein n=1 Tax=uncultured Clostridium sp. TaxID=59620 RepID=UPI0025E3AEF3|nr:hypothetical protein [uncultured Clostridium sp.]